MEGVGGELAAWATRQRLWLCVVLFTLNIADQQVKDKRIGVVCGGSSELGRAVSAVLHCCCVHTELEPKFLCSDHFFGQFTVKIDFLDGFVGRNLGFFQ